MKILIGMPSKDSWGGPASSEPPFVDALRAAGVEVTDEVYVYGDRDKPTPIFERIRRVVKTANRFRKILKKQEFDVIHLNTAFDLKTILRDSFSIFWMRPGSAKVFLKLHGSEAERFAKTNFFVRFLISFLKRRVDGFGIHTREEMKNFLELGFDERKFHFVKNAVTIHADLPDSFVRDQKEPNGRFRLLFVSRFIPAKGLIETIRACANLRDRGFDFELIALGDGETRSEAERLVAELELTDRVHFTGYIPESDVTSHFFDCDIFVFPTRHPEGFPNVLFKAVAVGLPIVTTPVRAAADYMSEPENCLFSTQDPDNIAEKIGKLIENTQLRESMSGENLKLGKSLLPAEIAREFLAIYENLR
ncbi:MAG: glycosyltransferase family 4 protein [Acidobacteria bacterium]|nr:glycosyltransferase family 4 protein [Acidobacteriota bacterium]MBK8147422.1 glycosyltransferase family 4 protein [Acidobacteriota bacterium]